MRWTGFTAPTGLRRHPGPRRAHDVVAVPAAGAEGRSGQRSRRIGPTAQAKWLTGSVTADSEQVVQAVFDQAEQRDA